MDRDRNNSTAQTEFCVTWIRFSHDKISSKPSLICAPEHFAVVIVYVESKEFSDSDLYFKVNLTNAIVLLYEV